MAFRKPHQTRQCSLLKSSQGGILRDEMKKLVEKPTSKKWNIHKLSTKVVLYVVDDLPLAFRIHAKDKVLIPSLYALHEYGSLLPIVVVHQNASRPIMNGADVMLPGIFLNESTLTDDALKNTLVAICIQGNNVPFAIGILLLSKKEMISQNMKGKGIKVVHSYQDFLWKEGPCIPPNSGFLKNKIIPLGDGANKENKASNEEEKVEGQSQASIATADNENQNELDTESKLQIDDDSNSDENKDEKQEEKLQKAITDTVEIERLFADLIRDIELPYPMQTIIDALEEKGVDISNSNFKSTNMLIKSLTRKGLIKTKDIKRVQNIKFINRNHDLFNANEKNNDSPSGTSESENESENEDSNDITSEEELKNAEEEATHLLIRAFALAVIKDLKRENFPLLASELYSDYILKIDPDVNIKDTTFGKFAKFLAYLVKQNIAEVKNNKGILYMFSVNKNHEIFKPYLERGARSTKTKSKSGKSKARPQKKKKKTTITIMHRYKPDSSAKFLFDEKEASEVHPMALFRERLTKYLMDKDMNDGKYVKLGIDRNVDELLRPEELDESKVTKHRLFEALVSHGRRYYAIRHERDPNAGFKSGSAPEITIKVERRQGRKLVTKIAGLEVYGIDPEHFSEQSRKKFACSCTTKPLPGSKSNSNAKPRLEVLIQGDMSYDCQEIIQNRHGIPPQLIKIITKARSGKSKRGRGGRKKRK